MNGRKKADAVFQGGGVRGIGFAGAVAEVEAAGYEFMNLAGTSAGSIIAGLLAVGYTAAEIKAELDKLDYRKFQDEDRLDRVPGGKAISLVAELGIYEGRHFEQWYERLLAAKGRTKFGQVLTDDKDERYRYKLQVVAADLSDQRMLVLPRDLRDLGLNPDDFSIARAVRMSMSIPVFFEPVKLEDSAGRRHVIVDGGILSNYPVWLLDDGTENPPWPTFGFKLLGPDQRGPEATQPRSISNIVEFLKGVWDTMFSAMDRYHISVTKGDYARTIGIPTVVTVGGVPKPIKTTDFGITAEESRLLYENGREAARNFLAGWDFAAWTRQYRALA